MHTINHLIVRINLRRKNIEEKVFESIHKDEIKLKFNKNSRKNDQKAWWNKNNTNVTFLFYPDIEYQEDQCYLPSLPVQDTEYKGNCQKGQSTCFLGVCVCIVVVVSIIPY